MAKYPIYLNLHDKRVVVIGAGGVGARKVQALADAGARIVVVAPNIDTAFADFAQRNNIEVIEAKYEKQYLAEAVICIAATDDRTTNERIYEDCQELSVLCNIVDVPDLCDFYVPAIVKRGPLQIAISTDGNCPAYAGHVRRKLEDLFTETHGRFVTELEKARQKVIKQIKDPNQRKALLGQLVKDESLKFFIDNGPEAWHTRANDIINTPQ